MATSIGSAGPYLAPWQAARTNPAWSFTAPGGWNVPNGSDLSFVDFTCLDVTAMPFDFSRCRLAGADLTGKTFGDVIHIEDVTLPNGTKPTIDRNFVIANIAAPSGLRSADNEEAAAEATAE